MSQVNQSLWGSSMGSSDAGMMFNVQAHDFTRTRFGIERSLSSCEGETERLQQQTAAEATTRPAASSTPPVSSALVGPSVQDTGHSNTALDSEDSNRSLQPSPAGGWAVDGETGTQVSYVHVRECQRYDRQDWSSRNLRPDEVQLTVLDGPEEIQLQQLSDCADVSTDLNRGIWPLLPAGWRLGGRWIPQKEWQYGASLVNGFTTPNNGATSCRWRQWSVAVVAASCTPMISHTDALPHSTDEGFADSLGTNARESLVNVVSVVGHSGDGKSYTLNKLFFGGSEVFATSSGAEAVQRGALVALSDRSLDPSSATACCTLAIDTEGLAGEGAPGEGELHQDYDLRREQMLLKIFAISDVIIYVSAENRVPGNALKFLEAASTSWRKYFSSVLDDRSAPAVVVLHLPTNTEPWPHEEANNKWTDTLGPWPTAFAHNAHVVTGHRGDDQVFDRLAKALQVVSSIRDVREERSPRLVYQQLQMLHSKFGWKSADQVFGEGDDLAAKLYGCAAQCSVCHSKCRLPAKHTGAHQPSHDHACKPTKDVDNIIYFCKACDGAGRGKQRARWANAGGVGRLLHGSQIDCEKCGVIWQSRSEWSDFVFTKDWTNLLIEGRCHITGAVRWIDGEQTPANVCTAQDAMNVITSCASLPAAIVGDALHWGTTAVHDAIPQLSEEGWSTSSECGICHCNFSKERARHHCRACGQSVCNQHSLNRREVPRRNHFQKVRVCDECFVKSPDEDTQVDGGQVPALRAAVDVMVSAKRAVVEPCQARISAMARPHYWEEDAQVYVCGEHSKSGCKQAFDGEVLVKHHCRTCGKIFCDSCCGHYHHYPSFTLTQRTCEACHRDLLNNAPLQVLQLE